MALSSIILDYELAQFPKVFSGNHISDPGVDYRQVKSFTILPEKNRQLNIDGEVLGSTPVEVEVLPQEIELMV